MIFCSSKSEFNLEKARKSIFILFKMKIYG
jgi:hypothetical protein